MKYKKKRIILYIFIFLFSFIKENRGSNKSQLYEKVLKTYKNKLPQNLIADVKSDLLERSLNKIPKDFYCSKKMKIKYLFIKDQYEKIIIENVKNPFINRFQSYIDFYTYFKAFMEDYSDYKDFLKDYNWSIKEKKKNFYIIWMKKKIRVKERYLLFFDSQNFLLKRIILYQKEKPKADIILKYKSLKGFFFFKEIFIKQIKKSKEKKIKMTLNNMKWNLQIDKNKILSLQEDCSKLENIFIK